MVLYADVRAPIPRPPENGLLYAANRLGLLDGVLDITGRGEPAPTQPPAQTGPAETADTGPESTADERVGGVTFLPNPCTGGGTYDPCDPAATPLIEPSAFPDAVQSAGFPVKIGVGPCDTRDGYTRDESTRIALEHLNVRQHYIVGREFWRGDQATESGLPTPFLADSSATSIAGEGLSVCGGLALLEEVIAGVATDGEGVAYCGGARGLIHASPALATAWSMNYLATRDPATGLLRTTGMGTYIISGPGYDGTGPGYSGPEETGDGESWAYATGYLQVRLLSAQTPPRNESIDKATNAYTQWAERGANVALDGCCAAAVQIDLGDCSVVPGSG